MTILIDENEAVRFIEKVIVPLVNDEVYILTLTARKKYSPVISSSFEVVAREIIKNSDTNRIMRKIRKLCVTEGLYTDKNENIIPTEAFGLYLLPEPRSTIRGYKQFQRNINEWIYSDLVGASKNLEYYRKLDTKLFSAIHASKSRSIYFIIDIDIKEEDLLLKVHSKLLENDVSPESIKWISETHGGYHVILERNEKTGKFIHLLKSCKLVIPGYDVLTTNKYVEVRKETATPTPGCLQGGFLVKEYKFNEDYK